MSLQKFISKMSLFSGLLLIGSKCRYLKKKLFKNICILRTGIVLSRHGGFVSILKLANKFLMSSYFGIGSQWQSWIHIDDLVSVYITVIEEKWDGIFNAVSPQPVTQKYLIKKVSSILKKPIIIPFIPSIFLKFFLGKRSILALGSNKIDCKRLKENNFKFEFKNIDSALNDVL